MNSSEKKARIVCRMKSVDVTRVIPSRWQLLVAIVDFPVPGGAADEEQQGSSSRAGRPAGEADERSSPPRRPR